MKIKKLLTGMLAAALLVSNVPAEDFVSGDVEESYSINPYLHSVAPIIRHSSDLQY